MLSPMWAGAAEVDLRLSSRETYVGVPVYAQISIQNAAEHDAPVFPEIPGVKISSAGVPGRSSQTTIINGKVTQNQSVTYAYQLVPQKAGTFVIPEITVKIGSEVFTTRSQKFVATKSETGDLLFVEIAGNREKAYVGEQVDLTLRIWIRPYTSRELQFTLSEADMWGLVSMDQSQWGVFRETLETMAKNRQRPRGREVLRKDSQGVDRSYYLYEIEAKAWPDKPGKIDGEAVVVIVHYPTGLARSDSFFALDSQLRLTGSRPLAKAAKVDDIEVLSVPTTNRPVLYRGAVGRYEISAQALPKEVYVGDPITLRLTVRNAGEGKLDLLQAPPLAEMPDLTKNFKVPEESLAGIVTGDTKTFTVSLRAKTDKATEIPSIPLVFFDPRLGQFGTARTEPIPLTVKPVDNLTMDRIVSANGTAGTKSNAELTEQAEGINANFTGPAVLETHSTALAGNSILFILAAGPLLFGGVLAGKTWRAARADPAQSRKRLAYKNGLRRLNNVSGPEEVAATLIQYVADRLDVIGVGMTRTDVAEKLRQHATPEEVIRTTDQLLGRCEEHLYSGNAQQHTAALAEETRKCMDQLERELK